MIDWDGGELPVSTKPIILVTSQGVVVDQLNQLKFRVVHGRTILQGTK